MKDSPAKTNPCQASGGRELCCTPAVSGDSKRCLLVGLGDEGQVPQQEALGPNPKPDLQGCRAKASSRLLFSAASALGGQCIGTGVWGLRLPHTPTVLIWGGKMNLVLINATLFIDLGKCLAAPIHLLKDNVIRAHIILYLSLGSEYVTLLCSTIWENKRALALMH